jgi:hypothetical protein
MANEENTWRWLVWVFTKLLRQILMLDHTEKKR